MCEGVQRVTLAAPEDLASDDGDGAGDGDGGGAGAGAGDGATDGGENGARYRELGEALVAACRKGVAAAEVDSSTFWVLRILQKKTI